MAKKPKARKLMPLRHYVALNVIVLVVLTLTYFASDWLAARSGIPFRGLFPVLFVVYVCFFFVSVYDAAYEWIAFRHERRREAAAREASRQAE